MKRRRLFDLLAGCSLVLTGLRCQGQDSFRYRALLDPISVTGFYTIELSPELLAKSNASLSDLRLRDGQGRFIPYVFSQRLPGLDSDGVRRLPDPVYRQKDSSDRHSYLELEWPEAYRVESLSFGISEPVLFKRPVSVYAQAPDGSFLLVKQVSITPRDTLFGIPVVKSRRLRVEIVNADNAPLRILAVRAWQDALHIVSFLQAPSSYEMLTGDSAAVAPEYDLHFFTDSMTEKPTGLKIGAIEDVKSADVAAIPPAARRGGDRGRLYETVLLWTCLLAVLLFLIYFSIRMVKAIGKKDTHDRL